MIQTLAIIALAGAALLALAICRVSSWASRWEEDFERRQGAARFLEELRKVASDGIMEDEAG